MTLDPGEASSDSPNIHANSDQTLILLHGQLIAEVDGKSEIVDQGDAVLVPARTLHKFTNRGPERATTVNIYSPPAYPE
jgi:mannose-6-phosphate isomerase-like protein (cupin superfamily)